MLNAFLIINLVVSKLLASIIIHLYILHHFTCYLNSSSAKSTKLWLKRNSNECFYGLCPTYWAPSLLNYSLLKYVNRFLLFVRLLFLGSHFKNHMHCDRTCAATTWDVGRRLSYRPPEALFSAG